MSEKGTLSKSIANNISEAIIDKLGGSGYAPNKWRENINLLGISSADIEEALASITEDTSSSDKGLLSLSIASDVGAMLNKKYNTSRGFKPCEVSSAVSALIPLPEKTTTGSIVTFSDGADDVPIKSCEVALPPSLDGYSSVDVVNAGKNLSSVSEYPDNPWNFWGTNFTDMVSILNTLKIGTYTISFDFEVETVPDSGDIQYGLPYIRALVGGSYVNLTSYSISAASSVSVGDIFRVSASFTLTDERVGNVSNVYIYCDRKDNHSGTGRGSYNLINAQVEVGSTASTFEPYSGTTYTASLGRTIYGGSVDVVNGEGTDENGNDFTFEPIEISSRLGNNTMWSEQGDTEVTYRADLDLYEAPSTLLGSNNTETEGNEE